MVMCWFQDVGSLGFRLRAACCCVCNNGRDPTVNLSPSTSLVVDVKYIGRAAGSCPGQVFEPEANAERYGVGLSSSLPGRTMLCTKGST